MITPSDKSGRLVVLAGGGTGGHVLPAIAIARALVAAGRPVERIRFIGAERGMEASMVPEAGFGIDLLPVRGLQRRLSAVGEHLRSAGALVRSLGRCRSLVRRDRVAVVVSVGGYAAVAPVLVARFRRIPVVAVSYDASAGLATRLAARLASARAVAFEPSPLRHAVVTGAPLRPEIVAVDRQRDRASARAALGVPSDRFMVAVVGGSLGSGRLNEATAVTVRELADCRDLSIRHVLGARNAADPPARLDGTDGLQYEPVGYEGRMDLVLAACDLLVARAGAATVAEVAALGVPAVLVPWPGAAHDHQRANARWLAGDGAALMIDDAEFTGAAMTATIVTAMADPDATRAMGDRAAAKGTRDGAARVAALVEAQTVDRRGAGRR